MARADYITPNLDEWMNKFHFFSQLRVRYCETDMSGHLNNTHHVVYFEQGRAEYLHGLGLYEHGLTAMTADICCHYMNEAFFNEQLKVGVRVGYLGNRSLDLEYVVYSMDWDRVVATGRGTMVIVDKETKKSTEIPEALRQAISQMEASSV